MSFQGFSIGSHDTAQPPQLDCPGQIDLSRRRELDGVLLARRCAGSESLANVPGHELGVALEGVAIATAGRTRDPDLVSLVQADVHELARTDGSEDVLERAKVGLAGAPELERGAMTVTAAE